MTPPTPPHAQPEPSEEVKDGPFRLSLVVEFPSKEDCPRIGIDSLGQLWNCKIVALTFADYMAEHEANEAELTALRERLAAAEEEIRRKDEHEESLPPGQH